MKKILALILVFVFAVQMCAFAADFKDMPNDWSTAALEDAVKNGLLTGDNGYIKASDNMTRAEMATIMARACGATRTADISNFTDVKADDWFFDSMSKAVAMGAFNGSDNKLNPDNPITRQEAFVVLSRVFGVAAAGPVDKAVLDSFKDKDKVDSWAKNDIAAIVEQGYVAGNDGYIKPLDNISRAEFAVVMSRMIKYYIDEPVEAIPTDGNVMIRTKDISLDGLATDKYVVLGDAIGETDIAIKDVNISGKLVLRGGKNVSVIGTCNAIAIIGEGVTLHAARENVKHIHIGKGASYNSSSMLMGQGK